MIQIDFFLFGPRLLYSCWLLSRSFWLFLLVMKTDPPLSRCFWTSSKSMSLSSVTITSWFLPLLRNRDWKRRCFCLFSWHGPFNIVIDSTNLFAKYYYGKGFKIMWLPKNHNNENFWRNPFKRLIFSACYLFLLRKVDYTIEWRAKTIRRIYQLWKESGFRAWI